MKQLSPEWFSARIGRVTGSSAGAILGLSPFSSRDEVMRRMVREYHGAESEMKDNPALTYGRNHEGGAIVDFRIETGLDVGEVGFLPYEDWLGASPDGLTDDGGVLEVKVPFSLRKSEDPKFKSLAEQPHYYAQVQIEMLCADASHAWFFQWAPNGTALEHIEPDQQWRDANLPILKSFHAEYLDAVKEPDDHLKPRRIVIDTPEASKLLREYDEMAEAEERAIARRKAILEELAMMAGQSNAEIVGRKLTCVTREGAISYAKALAELAPGADLEKWRGKQSTSWRLS